MHKKTIFNFYMKYIFSKTHFTLRRWKKKTIKAINKLSFKFEIDELSVKISAPIPNLSSRWNSSLIHFNVAIFDRKQYKCDYFWGLKG